MEDRLKALIEGNNEANRTKWAMEWKKQGKKVIGVMSSYVPEEAIWAAGMMPWRITGVWREDVSLARTYRSENSCLYCTSVLESVLGDELDFLDGIVMVDYDQDMLRLWDVMKSAGKHDLCHAMHIPYVDSGLNYQMLEGEIGRLIDKLKSNGGQEVTDASLLAAIETYNETRKLLGRLYDLRKREVPPVTGAEVMGITLSAQIMPKDRFNEELTALLPYLEKRKAEIRNLHPRILLTSEMLDNPAYLALVEEFGLIAMDDMDTGSQYFMQAVDASLDSPRYSLAKRYLSRHGAPRMSDWDTQAAQLIRWVKDFNIDAVLTLSQQWCYPMRFRQPYIADKLNKAGIPNKSFERPYHLGNTGQLRTRIEAFTEMLT